MAERYGRMGIPTAIVEAIAGPIQDAVNKRKGLRTQLDKAFSEWLLLPPALEDDPLVLLAVTPYLSDSEEFVSAEDLFVEQFLPALPEGVQERLDTERSSVIALDDLRVPQWTAAWKIDLDFLTYGSQGSADSPEPQQ